MTTTGFMISPGGWEGVWDMVREAEGCLELGGLCALSKSRVVLTFRNIFPSSGTEAHKVWVAYCATDSGAHLEGSCDVFVI